MTPADESPRTTNDDAGSERRVVDVFIELADILLSGFDLDDLLHILAKRCCDLFGASAVGLLLTSQHGRLEVVASSSERMHTLEMFEIQNSEGPSLDVLRTGRAIVNGSVMTDSRWPRFAPRARAAGYCVVHALPMRHDGKVIGVVNIFDDKRLDLDDRQERIAQALADIATFAILQTRALSEATDLMGHLQRALRSRVVIEQAKGVLSERLAINMADAFALLRDYSRNRNERIGQVATLVVAHRLTAGEIVAGARTRSSRRSLWTIDR